MSKKNGKNRVTPEEFIRIWQSSRNLDEIAKKTGMRKPIASARAGYYRRNGVHLQVFTASGNRALDWSALAKLAKS